MATLLGGERWDNEPEDDNANWGWSHWRDDPDDEDQKDDSDGPLGSMGIGF